ncbi:MAG TPA: GNAT family N-acetyltransferase [Acidimicrobiales bacterium]|nr:GNAT family N-acetyltransferase [Acidimicrobiales bacterium]
MASSWAAEAASAIRWFEDELARRSATSVVDTSAGFTVLDAANPRVYEHNRLVVTRWAPAGAVLGEAEEVLGEAGLGHRRIDVMDTSLVPALTGPLLAGDYDLQILAVMVWGGPAPERDGASVEEVGLAEAQAVTASVWRRQLPGATEEVVAQLVGRLSVVEAACSATHLAVRREGEVVASCHLYRLGTVAEIDAVATEPAWRGQGLASALVLDAVARAVGSGCEVVFLRADTGDWPRRHYARLGFVEVGREHQFVRPDPASDVESRPGEDEGPAPRS